MPMDFGKPPHVTLRQNDGTGADAEWMRGDGRKWEWSGDQIAVTDQGKGMADVNTRARLRIALASHAALTWYSHRWRPRC